MYTVEIRAGLRTDNVRIHTWLYITHSGGEPEAWGSYPIVSGLSRLT